jgi:uncharacterized membrane protein
MAYYWIQNYVQNLTVKLVLTRCYKAIGDLFFIFCVLSYNVYSTTDTQSCTTHWPLLSLTQQTTILSISCLNSLDINNKNTSMTDVSNGMHCCL